MRKQNEIKVFKPNSKQADFTIRAVKPEQGVRKLGEMLGTGVDTKARSAFRSLARLGAESLVFRHGGRKIKVDRATAA